MVGHLGPYRTIGRDAIEGRAAILWIVRMTLGLCRLRLAMIDAHLLVGRFHPAPVHFSCPPEDALASVGPVVV